MDALYMLVICTGALCYPVDQPALPDDCAGKGFCYRNEASPFTMTKAECETLVRRHGPRTALTCINEDEWTRRFPERPDKPIKPIKPIAH
jgi:hypothetical protein